MPNAAIRPMIRAVRRLGRAKKWRIICFSFGASASFDGSLVSVPLKTRHGLDCAFAGFDFPAFAGAVFFQAHAAVIAAARFLISLCRRLRGTGSGRTPPVGAPPK